MLLSEEVKCNLCGADHYRVLYKRPNILQDGLPLDYSISQEKTVPPERVVKCIKCDLVYVNPRIPTEEIANKYINMVDENYKVEEAGRRITARKIIQKLKKYQKPRSRLLEIGCANGFLLDEARKDGWETYGVELSKLASCYAKEHYGLNVFCGTLKEAKLPLGYFDVILLSDTIEHITDPKALLLEARPLLSPRGILYINTPNVDSLASKVLRARWWGLHQFHLYYFNKKTLAEMLEAAGFRAVKWGGYSRTFTVSYWLKRIGGHNKKIFSFLNFISSILRLNRNKLITMNIADQIEVVAQRQRKMEYLPELEREEHKGEKQKIKVTAVLPAYNAAKTLAKTVNDIPREIVDEIIVVDDASSDNTVEVAKQLGLIVFRHDKNKGYGGNQKTCYSRALERNADIVIMVHPDYQYDPKAIPRMIEPIKKGQADAVFGSRMLKGGALEGGMPLWKHNSNIILSAIANVILGTYLTEYHSGFRAYSADLLRSIRFNDNSDSFIFDTEIIIQILLHYFKIEEVPIRTRYFEEASVITLWAGFWYGVKIVLALLKYILHKHGLIKFTQFE